MDADERKLERVFEPTRYEAEISHMPDQNLWKYEGQERGWRQAAQLEWQSAFQRGFREGRRIALYDVLEFRFKKVPADLKATLDKIEDADILRILYHEAMATHCLNLFRATLDRYSVA